MINLIPWSRRQEMGEGGSLFDLRSEMDRLFDQFFEFPNGPRGMMSTITAPPLEVYDEDNKLVVSAELPGMNPEDIEISVSGDMLTISGEKREKSETDRHGVYRSEVRYGKFQRSIQLPDDVDTEDVTAEYDNGVLTLRMPRTEARQPKRIQVKAGSGRKQVSSRGDSQPGRQERESSSDGKSERSESRQSSTSSDRSEATSGSGNNNRRSR